MGRHFFLYFLLFEAAAIIFLVSLLSYNLSNISTFLVMTISENDRLKYRLQMAERNRQPLLISSSLLHRSTVLTRNETAWYDEHEICDLQTSDVVRATLNSPAGEIPIYVYPEKENQWISGNTIKPKVWERDEMKLVYFLMAKDKQLDFLDIGANLGVYGLTFANIGRRVVMIDPVVRNVRRLCKSVRENYIKRNVYVVHNALSDRRYKVAFGNKSDNVRGTFVKEMTSWKQEVAQAIILDDLLEIFDLEKVVMKVDVEPDGSKALLGGDNFFRSVDVKLVIIEWNAHRKDGKEIINFLTKHNMKPYKPSHVDEQRLDVKLSDQWPAEIIWKKD